MEKSKGRVWVSKIKGLDIVLRYSIQVVNDPKSKYYRGGIKVVMFNWKMPNDHGVLERKQIKRSIPDSENIKSEFKLVPRAVAVIENWFKEQMKTAIVNVTTDSKISATWEGYLEQRTGISEETKRPISYFFKRFFKEIKTDNIAELTPMMIINASNKIHTQCEKGEIQWKYWANIHSYLFGKGSSKNPGGGLFPWLIYTRKTLTGADWENLSIAAPDKNRFKTMHDDNKKNVEYYWEDEEIKAIHEELSIIWKDYFWIIANTGMDLSDLVDLSADHIVPVDRNPGKWKISKVRKKEARFGTRINIPLSDKIEKIILDAKNLPNDLRLNPQRLLFPDLKAKVKNSHSQLYNVVRTAWQRVYPKKRHKNIKALRHSFITKHLEKDTPLDVIQDFVGHSKKSTVLRERYKGTIDASKYINNV